MAEQKGQIAQFPSQAVSDKEKMSKEYGLKVGHAIEQDWFRRDQGLGRYYQTRDEYHRLRLYARGEQSVRKYKDEFAVNGDLSYLNLDWKPVGIIPKFVDIVVNGMQDRLFHIKALAQDKAATDKRTKFVEAIQRDLNTQQLLQQIESQLGVNARNVPEEDLPQNTEELDLYMQLNYKQGIEIAIEQAIDNVFMTNKYHEVKRRVDMDLVTLGIGCVKHSFNNTDGITVEWVDPADLIWSYTEDPNFGDVYYFGEIRRLKMNELKKQFPELTNEKLVEINKKGSNWADYNANRYEREDTFDSNTLNILYFNWKTWENDVYKIKETATGSDKAIEKDDTFNPPKDTRSRFKKVKQTREVIYEGAYVLGTEILLKWEKAQNMVRPNSNANKVLMNYVVSAPRLYKGRINSLVNKITPYADLIQLTHLKLQQVIQRMTPSGVYLDADGLAEIDLGNGTNYNPQEALNMYFQTGSIIGRSLTTEGEINPGKIPIQELPGGGGQQIELLIGAYNQYLSMIRDITGLNEARDGSDPDPYSLVGVQKLAAANSNTATRHILHASMSITSTLAEAVCLRFQDVLEFHPTKEAFIGSIGRFSVGSLQELNGLHMHDFGIFLDLEPDEDEKQLVEQNIQAALAKESIHLEDAIDIREIKNAKLANQLLKYRRVRKQQDDQAFAIEQQQAQAKAQADAQATVEQAKAQSQQVVTKMKIDEETAKSGLNEKYLQVEKEVKKELMQYEFELNVKLKQMEMNFQKDIAKNNKDSDERMNDKKMQVEEKKVGVKETQAKPSKSFESKGNDVTGGIDLSRFEPK